MVRNLVDRLFRILNEGKGRRTQARPGGSSLTTIGTEFRPSSHEPTMIRLETPRLTLMALTVQQMRWQRDSFARLEQALGPGRERAAAGGRAAADCFAGDQQHTAQAAPCTLALPVGGGAEGGAAHCRQSGVQGSAQQRE